MTTSNPKRKQNNSRNISTNTIETKRNKNYCKSLQNGSQHRHRLKQQATTTAE